MKKILFLVYLIALCPWLKVEGQMDTIMGRCDKYFYYNWYDTCERYFDCPGELADRNWFYLCEFKKMDTNLLVGRQYLISGKMSIIGVAVMGKGYFVYPEYLHVYQVDSSLSDQGQSVLLASVRWDSAAPFIMKLPQCTQTMNLGDPTKFMYPVVREVHFDRPVVVDSNFILAGTLKNSDVSQVYYSSVSLYDIDHCVSCNGSRNLSYNGAEKTWYEERTCGRSFGPFLMILDTASYQLTVAADSAEWGTVAGSGSYVSMSRVEISASPYAGYRFVGWNDGNMENPRMVDVLSDTTYVAFFAPRQGIEGNDGLASGFEVMPNPATDHVDVTVAEAGEYSLDLYDNNGRRVQSLRFSGLGTRVEVDALPSGSYYLLLRGNGTEGKKSFIKL